MTRVSAGVVRRLGNRATFIPGFEPQRLPAGAKWSFVTRNVPQGKVANTATVIGRPPISGDLMLARVERIAQHTRIQLRNGRRSLLYKGDHIVVVYGNRYAPDQFEAEIPADLDLCHLVAAGGVAAKAVSKHSRLKWPTTIRPVGLCVNELGDIVNLKGFGLGRPIMHEAAPKPVVAVLGTSMNSGKTTAVAALVKGLTAAGHRVAAVKATGTGSGNDLWAYEDAGAARTLDFTDAGYPSTYKVSKADIQECFERLLSACLADTEIDVTVVEIADGLLHFETADLVASDAFANRVDHVVFAAGEAMGAAAGVERLRQVGIEPLAVSGVLTASTLATAEAAAVTGVPILGKNDLESPRIAKLVG